MEGICPSKFFLLFRSQLTTNEECTRVLFFFVSVRCYGAVTHNVIMPVTVGYNFEISGVSRIWRIYGALPT
jgi:hypothetical protein